MKRVRVIFLAFLISVSTSSIESTQKEFFAHDSVPRLCSILKKRLALLHFPCFSSRELVGQRTPSWLSHLIGDQQSAAEKSPWIINTAVTLTQPMEVGDVIIVSGGTLNVSDVPAPGLRLSGNFITLGTGKAVFKDSVIQFMSTYHGQYVLAAFEASTIEISRCQYRVPNSVQHALAALGEAGITVTDTDFQFAQLIVFQGGTFRAERLNGQFEIILQDRGRLILRDIPRDPDKGELWVWPDFPEGSRVTYSPPLPGFIDKWSFPPRGSNGIFQICSLKRCRVKLWPLLVKPGCELTLKDIPPENWVVVGFHLPNSAIISDLRNGLTVRDALIGLPDRIVRLIRVSVDTFNLYAEQNALITVRNSHIGELLASGQSEVIMQNVIVDGSGGFFGSGDNATVDAEDCLFTCDVQATSSSTISFHNSDILPYPIDITGAYTSHGAYGSARLLLDSCITKTSVAAGERGLIATCRIDNAPSKPPGSGEAVDLRGTVVQFSPDAIVASGMWRFEVKDVESGGPVLLGQGLGNLQSGFLGTWRDADPSKQYELRLVLIDGLGRSLTGVRKVSRY